VQSGAANRCVASDERSSGIRDGDGVIVRPISRSAAQAKAPWGRPAESPDQIVEHFGRMAEAGVQHVIISTADAYDPAKIELLGRDVLPPAS
jgi:hypothetical protein